MTLEEKRAWEKDQYDWYKSHGICVHCRHEKAAKGHVLCLNCLDDARVRYYKNHAEERKKRWAEHREEEQARKRALYHERKEQGLCTKCGKPARFGTFCYTCYIRQKARRVAASDARGNIRQIREENGLCLKCGEPLNTNKKLCAKCCDFYRTLKTEWWQRLKEDPERYAEEVRKMRPVSTLSFYGKYEREGVVV